MSLRGFFSRNIKSHSRRKNGLASSALASRVEFLEDRVLLSVESPLLQDHGVTFTNLNVLDQDVTFFAANNPLYSNNVGGSGLSVTLDGNQVFGNPPATPAVPQLRSVALSPNQGPLAFNNNANVGASISLQNLTLDELRIDGSTFDGNGRAGLIINLNNVQIGSIIIVNSAFLNNANDGLCILANSSSVDNIILAGNNFTNNAAGTLNDGALIQFRDSRLGNVLINNNLFNDSGANGIRIDLDNTNISSLDFVGNNLNGNSRNGNASGAFFDFQDSDVDGSVTGNIFTNNTFTPNPFNPNLTQGDGLRIQMRRSILPDGTTASGLRNLDLDRIGGNTIIANGGAGINIDLGENTTIRTAITGNLIASNGRAGLNLMARDTQNAFDVQIGGTTLDSQNNNLDANRIEGNRGAGIAITLDDTSSVVGNTSGRFRILNNEIIDTQNDNLLITEFAGEGIFVRVRGSVALVNGAARLLNSQVDGNIVTGNASHGIAFDISEDSEVLDLLIGDVFNPANPSELPEGDGFIFQNQIFRNSGNLVQNNLGSGLNFLRRDAALARDVRVIDNLFEGNGTGVAYTVRNLDNVVNTVTFNHNDMVNNVFSGMLLETQIDAILVADLDNNLISGNNGDGILTLGFEGDATDRETLGGVWTRNTVQGNNGIGININGVPGTLSPLTIGLLGTDERGRSLGNLVDSNGDDGIEINTPGVIELINNVITFNGQNNTTQNVHGDGKGIDINLNDNDAGFNTSGGLNAFLLQNVIQSNQGDGLEIVSRGNELLSTLVELVAFGNIIDLNLGRGVDVLNAGTSDTYLVFGDGSTGTGSNRNIIRSNGLEGFYTVNTSSTGQRQDLDAAATMVADTNLGGNQRFRSPDLTLDLDGNEIQDNGLPGNFGQLNGSGLVIRVGTTGSIGFSEFAAATIADRDGYGFNVDLVGVGASNSSSFLQNGRVNARVNNNRFGGNLGVDVITESFVSTLDPPTTAGTWNATNYDITGNSYRTDPLARLNFEFTNNTGNSVDLVRLGAFYNNAETDFKSRTAKTGTNPSGPFGNSAGRFRNAQRLPDRPSSFSSPDIGTGGLNSGFGFGVAGSFSSVIPGGPNSPIVINTDPRAGFVFDATNATPIVITSFNHGLATGEFVEISGVLGNTAANGIFRITVIDQDTFSLQDPFTLMDVMGNGGYLGGGSWTIFPSGGHGLQTGDVVALSVFSFDNTTPGFDLDGVYEITVINPNQFALNGTEGETHVPFSFFGGDYLQVTNFFALMYPGVGGSTFRIIESGNNFPQGNDFSSTTFEDEIFYAGGGTGHLGYTFDREVAGTFNFRTISASDAVVTEGGQAEFLITLDEAMTTDLIVSYRTEFAGSASDGISSPLAADYTFTSDFAIIPAGQTQVSVFIDTEGDTTFEGEETFKLVIDSASTTRIDPVTGRSVTDLFATPIDPFGLGTILDDDLQPTITISDAGGFEKGDGTVGSMTFTVTLSNPSDSPVFVDFVTADFTANVDVDYRARQGTLTFAPGETVKTITVEILSDSLFPTPGTDVDQETLFLNLSSPQGAVLADSQGLGTIFEPRFVSISDAFANGEGNSPNISIADFVVTLTDAQGNPSFVPSGQTITVNFNTANGSATAGSDFVGVTNGVLVFNEFDSQLPLSVTVNQDRIFEGDENFRVVISTPEGTIRRGTAIGNILEPLEVASTRDASGQAVVQVFDYRTGIARFNINPYPGFLGEARVATADFNGDGITDIVTAAGRGGGPHIKVLNGINGSTLFEFFAYGSGFRGGVFVATGDINNDGRDDIITGPDVGGGPHIRVFDGTSGNLIENFFASGLGIGFTGGVRVAAGNVDGIGGDEIIIGYGPGSQPLVEVYTADGNPLTNPNLFNAFHAYDVNFQGGVFVSAADVGAPLGAPPDGLADIITGTALGAPHVKVFSGTNPSVNPNTTPAVLESFFAYNVGFIGGVRVASGDVSNDLAGNSSRDRVSEIITSPGFGGGPHIRAFSIDANPLTAPVSFIANRFPFSGTLTSGTYVAGRTRGFTTEGSPLMLDANSAPAVDQVDALTQDMLQPVVEAAFDRLRIAGVSESSISQLSQLEFVIADLDGTVLGRQTPGRIYIDRTAAGRGYFVDLTPDRDEEYSLQNGRLIASDQAAQDRVDLLTVVLHELGHALGEDHAHDDHDLLSPTLTTGERRLPEFDEVFSDHETFQSLLNLN